MIYYNGNDEVMVMMYIKVIIIPRDNAKIARVTEYMKLKSLINRESHILTTIANGMLYINPVMKN